MTASRFIRHCTVATLGCLLAVHPHAVAKETPAHPNVLFIAVDDLNDWIGCMKGHPQARTPNMDRLAQRGVLFTNAHCAAPVCLASRTALFSGRYPDQTGVFSNWGETKGKPPAESLQMPLHFSASGYETLGAGKLYHSASPQFFDDYYDTENRWSPFTREQAKYTDAELPSKGSPKPEHRIQNGPGGRDWILPLNGLPSERNPDSKEGESFDWGPVDVSDDEMGDTRVTNWAIQKLGEPRAKPFFLGTGFYRPHIPLFAPQQDFDALPPAEAIELPASIPDDLDDLGEAGKRFALDPITAGTHKLVTNYDQWKPAVRAYLACITYVDRQIGRLMEELEKSPHTGNTWIILFSDHGWQLGEKQHWGKWTGWRTSTRVPLIIVPPTGFGDAARGKACTEPVSLMDLYPTLIEVCHLAKKEGISGQSLVPLLKNPSLETGRAVVTAFDPGNHSLSTREWRYMRYANGEEELYDIQADPHEWHNLAHFPAHQARLAGLRQKLDEELKIIR
ncbi:sulfatase [Prosthecobacter sp. SYSU 5D2]|uniref:sulfatase n=1 Tax=Prosthecobacter sp. SYSU 5D2 TaxID=3134134 RepID=UPI0031FF0002